MKLKQFKIRDVVNRNYLLLAVPFITLSALASTRSAIHKDNASLSSVLNSSGSLTNFQQQLVGQVLDESGRPVQGVEVKNLKSSLVTVTDAEGKFRLSGSASDKIQFSSIGFKSKVLDGTNVQAVVLEASESELEEVVVVGYGTQRKSNITGAVSSVKFDEKTTSRGLSNISQALQGAIPGLAVSQNSGMAGNNAADLLIRGLGTVNSAGPLIVVDGMPDVNMNRLNVNDIESVTVLKDASSAAVYGSRAANGVVLITTKSGKLGTKAKISASGNWQLTKPTQSFDFVTNYAKAMDATQRAENFNTLSSNFNYKNGTIDEWLALSLIDPKLYPSTNWWDVVLRDGQSSNYNVSITGGGENNKYYLSAGILDEKGIQIRNDFKRYNTALNFETGVGNNIDVGLRFSGNWSKYQYNYENGMTADGPSGVDLFASTAGVLPYDPFTGYYGGAMAAGETSLTNNIYADYMRRNQNNMNQKQALMNGFVGWRPFKGFLAKAEYILNYDTRFQWKADLPTTLYNFQTNSFNKILVADNEGISNINRENYKTQLNLRLSYDTKFGEDHDFSVLGVYSEEYWNNRILSGTRRQRIHPDLTDIDAGAQDEFQTVGGSTSTEGLRSYIGRMNYVAFGKYLFEGSFRVDGSSRFLPENRYGFFPSGSVGWKISDESFFQNIKPAIGLDLLKLRASYGALGNNNGVGFYEQQENLTKTYYYWNQSVVTGLTNKKLINYELTWEKTSALNIGMDLAFFNNRLTAELEYYNRKTTGMNRPSDISIHLSSAYTPAPRRNIGDMVNRGVEANITWNDRFGDLKYTANFNVGYNKNKLLSWNEKLQRGPAFIDMPFNFVYAFESLGIAQTWEDVYKAAPQGAAPGDILLKDVNGDGRIDATDRVAYPEYQLSRPKTNFGFNGSLAYKNFDFSFILQGATGRKEFWMARSNSNYIGRNNQAITTDQMDNTWNLDNRDADYPRLMINGAGAPGNAYLSTFWLQNLSYLRVKNLQLGYTFKQNVLNRIGVGNVRVFGSADNLAVFTKFTGLDPEKSSYANDAYPITKSFVFGLNIDL